jgi:hypothetical protein
MFFWVVTGPVVCIAAFATLLWLAKPARMFAAIRVRHLEAIKSKYGNDWSKLKAVGIDGRLVVRDIVDETIEELKGIRDRLPDPKEVHVFFDTGYNTEKDARSAIASAHREYLDQSGLQTFVHTVDDMPTIVEAGYVAWLTSRARQGTFTAYSA